MHAKRPLLLVPVALSLALLGHSAEAQSVVFKRFPQQEEFGILCWSSPVEGAGFVSQIVVFHTNQNGITKLLWESPLDNSYSPEIRFMPEITVEGLALALVERKTGAASGELDVVGKSRGRVRRLTEIDGYEFEVTRLGGSKLPLIVAHRDASILDVPEIYRWNGSGFVEDSAAHPDYYRELLAEDEKKITTDTSAAVLVNLARIAMLSGDRAEAKSILETALAREQNKGAAADKETLRRISEAQRSMTRRRAAAPEMAPNQR
jgi:hypothetical protein